jgi:hypothetical protein
MSQPISITTRPISEEDMRILREQAEIRIGVAEITFAWAAVENAFVMLLGQVIGRSGHLASAIYFTPAGIEVRGNIVDKAFRCFVRLTTLRLPRGDDIEKSIIKEWASLQACPRRLRQTRNKVAHWEITIFGGTKGRPSYARLTAPILQMDDDREEALLKGQRPGMGANELKISVNAVRNAVNRILYFTQISQLLNARDGAALLQILAEAEAKNHNQPQKNTQTPQGPESPPSPSQE